MWNDDGRTRRGHTIKPRSTLQQRHSALSLISCICILLSSLLLLLLHPVAVHAVPRTLSQYLSDTFGGPGPYSPTQLQNLVEFRSSLNGFVVNLANRELTDAAALNSLAPLGGPFAIIGLDLSANLISTISLASASCSWCASEGLTHIFLAQNALTSAVLGLGTNPSPGLFGMPPMLPSKGLRDTVIYLDLSENPLGPGGLPPKFGGSDYWFNGPSSSQPGGAGATDPTFLCRSCGLTALSAPGMFPRTFKSIDLSYNAFTNPATVVWANHFGNSSFGITGTLDLSHSGLRALPAGAIHTSAATNTPPVGGSTSSSLIDLSYSNFASDADWSLSGLQFPGSVVLSHCGIGAVAHSMHLTSTVLGNLDLSYNDLRGNATLKNLVLVQDSSASIETGVLNLAHSNLTALLHTSMSGLNAARVILSGNNFAAASSWESQVFAGASIKRLEIDRAGLTADTLSSNDGNPFEKIVGLQHLSLSNEAAQGDAAYDSSYRNRFDPLSNSFLFGADGALSHLASLALGDVVSLDSAGFFSKGSQSFLSDTQTLAAVDVTMTLAAGVAPLGTQDPATVPQRLRGPLWNLLTGYENVSVESESRFNYSLVLLGSSWADVPITPLADQDAEDALYGEGARLYPIALSMPLEPALLHEEFFQHFPGLGSVTYGAPSDSNSNSDDIPWNSALSDASLSASLLSRAQGLTSFAITLPRTGSPASPLTTLPSGFFQSLRPDTGFGSLISIDLSAANFSAGYPQDLFAGLSRTGTSVNLDMNILYSGQSPIPIGLFDSLSSVSVGSYALVGTAKLNKARNCPFIGVSAQYYPGSLANECNRCPSGSYSNSVSGFFYCARCTPGSYCLANAIKPCDKGFYQPDSQSSSCLACGAGSYSEATGQSQPYSCIPCSIGRFSAVTNATAKAMCEPCEAGSIAALPGTSACAQCNAGSYADALQVSCTSCPTGQYGDVAGAANRTAGCTDCPGGSVTLVAGATGKGSCVSISCGAGEWYRADPNSTTTLRSHFCRTCDPGYSCSDNARTACKAGSWSAGSAPKCELCAPGKYSAADGGTSVDSCLLCPSGTFNNAPGQASCTSCASGTRNPHVGSSNARDCEPCDPGPAATTEGDSSSNTTLCVSGSASSIELSSLLPAAVALIEATSASSLSRASYTPVRGGPSLRLTSSDDATLALAGAYNTSVGSGSAHSSDFDPTGDLVNSSTMFIVLLVLLIAAVIPLFAYRIVPIKYLYPLDVMSLAHKLAPGGVKVHRPTQWGVAWSLCFICLAIFTAIQLGITSNAQLLNTLQPAAANSWSGSAQSALQITLKAYGAPANGSGLPFALDSWCTGDSAMSASSGGFTNGNLSARSLIAGSACVLMVDCLDCGIGSLGSVTLTLPYVAQLLEWEVWVTGAIPGSWSRFYGVVSQLPNSMLDAQAALHFSAIEAYFIDTRATQSIAYCTNPDSRTEISATGVSCSLPGSTSGSGFELAFSDYETLLAQDRTAVTAASQVALTFDFKKQDVVYQTTITAKLSLFQILSSVLATVVSLLSVFMLLFAMSEAWLLRKLGLTSGPLQVDVHIMSKAELAVETAAARKRALKLAGLSTPTASSVTALNSPEGAVTMRKVNVEAMSPTPALAAAAGSAGGGRSMGEPHAYGAAIAAASTSQLWAQRAPAPSAAAGAGSLPGSVPDSDDPSPHNGGGGGETSGAERGESFLHLNRDMQLLLQRTDGGGGLEGESDSTAFGRSSAGQLASAKSAGASAGASRYALANVAEEEVLLAPASAGFAAAAAARSNVNRQVSVVSQEPRDFGASSVAADTVASPSVTQRDPPEDDAGMLASPSVETRSVSPGASPNPPSTLTQRNRGSLNRGGSGGSGGSSFSASAAPAVQLSSLITVPRVGLPPLSTAAAAPPGPLAPLVRPRSVAGSSQPLSSSSSPPPLTTADPDPVSAALAAPAAPAAARPLSPSVEIDAEASASASEGGAEGGPTRPLMTQESIDFE